MREKIVRSIFAVTMSLCAWLAVTLPAVSSDGGMRADIESEFAVAVSRVAALRETNRSTAIGVTDLFKEITDRHQPAELQSFLASHYKLVRTKDAFGNVEFANIDAESLRKFDRRFFPQDTLRIGFRYNADWKSIVETFATLFNDGGI